MFKFSLTSKLNPFFLFFLRLSIYLIQMNWKEVASNNEFQRYSYKIQTIYLWWS